MERKFGSLWENESKKGTMFLGGEMIVNGKKVKIVAFKRLEKKNDKASRTEIVEVRAICRNPKAESFKRL